MMEENTSYDREMCSSQSAKAKPKTRLSQRAISRLVVSSGVGNPSRISLV